MAGERASATVWGFLKPLLNLLARAALPACHAVTDKIAQWLVSQTICAWRLMAIRARSINGQKRLVWMAPALQGLFDGMAAKSGTVLCPAC